MKVILKQRVKIGSGPAKGLEGIVITAPMAGAGNVTVMVPRSDDGGEGAAYSVPIGDLSWISSANDGCSRANGEQLR